MKKIISLFFAISILCVFASASGYDGYSYLNVGNIGSQGTAWDFDSGTLLFTSSNNLAYRALASSDGVMPAIVSNSSDSILWLYFVSNSNQAYVRSGTSGSTNSPYHGFGQNVIGVDYPDGVYSDSGVNLGWSNATLNYPVFASLQDAVDAYSSFINAPSLQSSFSLPAGNVAYIKYSGSGVVLNCHQPISSTFGSSPWPNTNQYYGFSSYLPSSSTVFPLSNQNVIPWQRSGNPTILGQYYDSSLTISGSTGQYLIVYNPYFSDLGNINSDPPNGDIVITVPNATQIIVYPILGSYSGGSLIGMSEDDWSSSFTGVIDSESGSVTFFNNAGNPSDPTIGGSNFSPEDITATGFLNKIVSVLEGIVKSLTSIFGFAYEAIISLVGLASNFVAVLGGLYTWLPSPLYTVLVSAITLAITIGVFKVFL